MSILTVSIAVSCARHAGVLLAMFACASSASAACAFAEQGEGHVAEIIDGRSFRLDDGREIKLAGLETTGTSQTGAALAALIRDRDVTLRGADDMPDRYGRQTAFVFVTDSDISVQQNLLIQGEALRTTDIADRECAAALAAAETEARDAKRGIWADASVIKNAESPDDILAGMGRFAIVEGTVLSVRQAGAVTYLNFGRNWTRGFAVTISRRVLPAIETAGLAVKTLENRRIRVRGWVEAHPGPRIDVTRAAQIELVDKH